MNNIPKIHLVRLIINNADDNKIRKIFFYQRRYRSIFAAQFIFNSKTG